MRGMAGSERRWTGLLCALLAALLLSACGKQAPVQANAPKFAAPAPQQPSGVVEYTFGVTPMSNFRNIYDVFQPILDHINEGLPNARLVLEVPRGLAEHEQQLQARGFAFALSNPYHTWRAASRDGYRIFAKMGDDDAFRGIWVMRKDSGIKTLAALRGKKVSFPPRSALAATMMTQLQLKEQGIDPVTDIEAVYVGSQHASVMAVFQKDVAAGATWPLAWTTFQRMYPAEARQLEVRFPTASLVNQGIVARDDVPPEVVRRVGELMFAMHGTEKGRALLAKVPITVFEPAGNAQYDVVRTFMDKYRQAFPGAAE
jgi:phosphonate transport system substrate-binding protein